MIRNNKGQFIKGENIKDLTGNRYGKLVVLCLDKAKTNKKSYWTCKCDCGNTKSIRGDCLGTTLSCGCIKKKQDIVNLGITYNHNMTNNPLFPIWNGMIQRCERIEDAHYHSYGGRGIKICDEWHDVVNFINWAELNGYKKGLTIERKDVNGNYCPENCEFITMRYQCFNKRNTLYSFYFGKKVAIAQFAYENNLDYHKVYDWFKQGKPLENLI